MNIRGMFDKSALIVAHPDDEVLFFSSVLTRVDSIVIVYLTCLSQPVWTHGRWLSLNAYPLSNISCLEMTESNTFDGVDWTRPVVTEYGLAINNRRISDTAYKKNFFQLKERLCSELQGYANIFSHNPWGEYGHPEHVQLYRVLRALQGEMHFTLWFSNYCSNKSLPLMLQYMSGFFSDYTTLQTEYNVSKKITDIYKRNNCWTWYDDWNHFLNESFMVDNFNHQDLKKYGHFFPLNFIKLESKLPTQNKFTYHKIKKLLSIRRWSTRSPGRSKSSFCTHE